MPAVGRRWLVPEVVQTSSMDCGPAALKCLMEGFYVPVSYGRLREACQTFAQMIDYLFAACIESSKTLNIDKDFRDELIAKRARLEPTQISGSGRVQEWPEDYAESEPHHRHVSHLWGLYPGDEISTVTTPDLAAAFTGQFLLVTRTNRVMKSRSATSPIPRPTPESGLVTSAVAERPGALRGVGLVAVLVQVARAVGRHLAPQRRAQQSGRGLPPAR